MFRMKTIVAIAAVLSTLPLAAGAQGADLASLNASCQTALKGSDVALAERECQAAVEEASGRRRYDAEPKAVAYDNLGDLQLAQGKLAEAEESYRRGISLRERAFGKYAAETAVSYDKIGNALLRQKKYPDAEILFARALENREKSFGEQSQIGRASCRERV